MVDAIKETRVMLFPLFLGRFVPTKEECSRPVESNCTVSVLLPASEGPGVCCKGLMFFLANAHNELVDAYQNSLVSSGSTRYLENERPQFKVMFVNFYLKGHPTTCYRSLPKETKIEHYDAKAFVRENLLLSLLFAAVFCAFVVACRC